MGWTRIRSIMAISAVCLFAGSCGGVDVAKESTEAPELVAGQNSIEPTRQPSEEQVTSTNGDDLDERFAVITIDGEATTYTLGDITYSNVEGVDDLTFERCDPNFFSSGRFYAIGYAVESGGELIVGENGQPAGAFTMDLPPDDWEATQRDAPEFDIQLNGLDIEIASPEEAAGGTMTWTIDDTSVSGTAVFADFEGTYTVDFEVVCEGAPAVAVESLPTDDSGDSQGGPALAGGGSGSYTVDGEVFDGVPVFACEPFSFGSDGPHPDDLSLFAYREGTEGINIDISHTQGLDLTDGSQFDQIRIDVFHSRQGAGGIEQFDGSAVNDADGGWHTTDPDTLQQTPLDGTPFVIEGGRISGSLAGLAQSWPDEGAATVDVMFDLEIPTEVNEDC